MRLLRLPCLTFVLLWLLALPALAQNRVVAPLTGTVTAGSWVTGQRLNLSYMPHGFLNYDYLLPQGYDPNGSTIYPILVFGHTNTVGSDGSIYPHAQIEFGDLGNGNGATIDAAFNNTTWRRNYPAIVLIPYCDQTDGLGGTGENFGGYGDSPDSTANERAVVAMVQDALTRFKADPGRVYATGWSLGGIGSTAWILDNNSLSGTGARLFTAALPISGRIVRSPNPIPDQMNRMAIIPILEVSGSNDTTSPPADFNRPAYNWFAGSTNYPSQTTLATKGVVGLQAGTSNYHYLEDTGQDHAGAYYKYGVTSAGAPLYDWLFSQVRPFHTDSAKITDPDGKPWKAYGLNTYDGHMGDLTVNGGTKPLTTLFPGVNFVRLAAFHPDVQPSSFFTSFVNTMTSNKIVVEIEHHQGAGGVPALTGADLVAENAWWTELATAFKNNPYVWFGTLNEPVGPGADISAEQLSNYNTIRNAGNFAPIMLEPAGDYADSFLDFGVGHGMTASSYAGMHRTIWDFHYYNWVTGSPTAPKYSTSLKDNKDAITRLINEIVTITSSEGTMPVIIGEYGVSTVGIDPDPGGAQAVQAVIESGYGSAAWNWNSSGTSDNLVVPSVNGSLTADEGVPVAAYIAQNLQAPTESLSMNTVGPVPQNTAFSVSGNISGATTAPTLQYQNNGGPWQALPSGFRVTSTSYTFTNPALGPNSVATVAVRDANNNAVSVTSNPFVVTAPESPNLTVVTTVGPTIIDAVGTPFSIAANGTILANGLTVQFSANVIELAYVNHVLWQKNSSGDWYSESDVGGVIGTASGPTKVSPLPAANEAFTVNTVPNQTAGAAFTITGTITGATAAPAMQYQINGGSWVNFVLSVPTGTRDYAKQPGGALSAWNTPVGNGATFGSSTDLDTIDIARGWNGSAYTAGPVGIINGTAFFGATSYIGSATDSQYTFSSTQNGRTQGTDCCATLTARMHVPTGAITPGPYPGDNAVTLIDPAGPNPTRQYTWGGLQLQPPGIQTGQGPFSTNSGEWDDATSDSYGEDYETGLSGSNVGAGLVNACDVTITCNKTFPFIQHALRYSTDAHLLKENGTPALSQTLKANSWPDRLQDGQSGINLYSGHLLAGTTLAIPSSTAQPVGLNANCIGMFKTMVNYPLFFRDQAGGGFHLSFDQVAATGTYFTDIQGCLPTLVGLLRPMRNQHVGGTSFATNPKNGPGQRLDTGPPLLIGQGGTGGATVTTTSFTLPLSGLPAASTNTISVRDAANPTAAATSNTFAVAALATESFSLNPIGTQLAATAFTVSGTISAAASPPNLQYQDNGGAWLALPTGATVTSTTFSFVHPGVSATSSEVVSIRDANAISIVASSNTFAVSAQPVEAISVSAIANQRVGSTFTVSGSVLNAPTVLSLQYQDSSAGWQPFPAGFSLSGNPGTASYSFTHPTMVAQSSTTVSVRDANNTAIVGTSAAFSVLPATSANNSVVTTLGPAIVDATGESFTLATGQRVAVNGVTDPTSSQAVALAYVSGTVWYEDVNLLWRGKTIAANAWAPPAGTSTSPLPAETLTIGTIPGQSTGKAFTVTGSIISALLPPALQYNVSGGTWLAFPSGSSITTTGWTFLVPAISTIRPATTIGVRDANATSITATSNTFSVTSPATETLSMQPIGSQPIGQTFAISGTITGLTSPPILQYQDNNGAWNSLPSGAVVTSSGYNFIHPALSATQAATVSVRDSANPTVVVVSPTFVVLAQESTNLSTCTTQGCRLIDNFGVNYTITAGKNVALNGITDATTLNVIEIAYVNRSIWYETASLQWFQRVVSNTWSPVGGTLLGPLPSSKPGIFLTSAKPLAVVPGFSIAVPGVVVNDTVVAGNFVMSLTSTHGVLNMPGATGVGTPAISMNGNLPAINAGLSQLHYTGSSVGTGVITILVTDPAGIVATAAIPVTVPRAASSITGGPH